MSKTKTLMIFLSGVAIGGLLGFVISKEKHVIELEDELESMREFYEKREGRIRGKVIEEVKEEMVEEIAKTYYTTLTKPYSTPSEAVDSKGYKDEDEEYIGLTDVIDEDYHDDDPIEEPLGCEYLHEEPYIITRWEFDHTNTEMDKMTAFYYDEDGVLADEGETIIPDVDTVVGVNNLTMFGVDGNDSDVLYIRNKRFGADYEVYRLRDSFAETVLGISPTKPLELDEGDIDENNE